MAEVGFGILEKIQNVLEASNITSYICDEGATAPVIISAPETVSLTSDGTNVTMVGSQLYEIIDNPVNAKILNIGSLAGENSYTIIFDSANYYNYSLPYGRYNVTSLTITVQG